MKVARISQPKSPAFSLLELLVSMVVMVILMLVIVGSMRAVQGALTRTKARTEQFREARSSLEALSRRLGQATLNAYWGYNDPNNPRFYQRRSELHFVSGPAATLLGDGSYSGHSLFFQAPFGYAGTEVGTGGNANVDGLEDLMNAWGYYVEFGSDLPDRPEFLKTDTVRNPERKRFRLMEFRQPSEYFSLYRMDGGNANLVDLDEQNSQTGLYTWFRSAITGGTAAYRPSWSIGENILCVVFSPQANGIRNVYSGTNKVWGTDIAPDYTYDSRLHQYAADNALAKTTRHQLPPELQMTVIAMDEASWQRIPETSIDTVATGLMTLVNSKFQKVVDFDDDLKEVEAALNELRIDYRVFTTTVALRGAKWITDVEQ
jgi:uncharacterized protein (TIGR02599 family)